MTTLCHPPPTFFARPRAAAARRSGSSGAVEELADVLEVVYALAADLGTDQAALDRLRRTKATERGAFANRVVWLGVED
ncbi:nucleoside triphosphate pyrophosphohydrolase [Kribbella sp. CA-293567]|uniref:nucleoside triphosphate pyrophosphohydrolase n=1 Tax=Kribbella sp. CA-293567 TaxID=3002436 RepID=UPI0022DE8892|nr:nucleoside triphosphate pyrophosphohydrolase [Kribbella sp. CA-293567]WBQ06856.1 nucleoside triphosphate pyrophosphohydrolase [Kribbella sp. CA-293567]